MGRFFIILSGILIIQYAFLLLNISSDLDKSKKFKSKARFVISFIPFGFILLGFMDLIKYFNRIGK